MAPSATDLRKSGSIARLFSDKAYGFIYCPADARDYFFHQVHLENVSFRALQEADVVTFIVGQGTKGLQAEEVRFERHHALEGGEGPPTHPTPKPHTPPRRVKP